MKLNFKIIILLLALTTISCGSNKKIFGSKDEDRNEPVVERRSAERSEDRSENSPENSERSPVRTYASPVEEYIATYAAIAQEEMKLYQIPASITLAQGILESGAGKGDLTRRANNHFGIKCHDWEGGRVYHDDDEKQECFRKYKDAKYSFRDHSLFLSERKRYADLFELDVDDYEGWAKGLRAAGYATDRKYPAKLIGIIERYQLYRYDAEVLGKDIIAYQENPQPSVETYVVRKGDTLYSIAKRYNLSVKELQQYNNLAGSAISIGQQLYLQPLKNF